MKVTKDMRRRLSLDNKKWPEYMRLVPESAWPDNPAVRLPNMVEVWRSSKFLAQVFDEGNGALRVSVCRTVIDELGKWRDNISWDSLMLIKREIGRGDLCALEVLPADKDIVNVSNMRHFWILKDQFFRVA